MSFEELYKMYANEVYIYSFWLSGNSDEAKDIASETFLKAWINFSKIRTETLKGFLFTIARNIFIDHKRKNKQHIRLETVSEKISGDLEIELERKNELERIYSILNSYSEIDRSVFLLRVQQGLSYKEISNIFQISVSSAKMKVYRIRKKILYENM